MYAIIESGGKQYKVTPGETILLEKLPGEKGGRVEFPKVLLVGGQDQVRVGAPYLPGVVVRGEILAQERGEKVTVFKFKKRKKYRRTQGHRQNLTRLRVTEIVA